MDTIVLPALALALSLAVGCALALAARALAARLADAQRTLVDLTVRLVEVERALVSLGDSDAALTATCADIGRRIGRLDGDLMQREFFRGAEPRHGDAIEAVRAGATARTIAREHGLSLDEAELLVSLHRVGPPRVGPPQVVRPSSPMPGRAPQQEPSEARQGERSSFDQPHGGGSDRERSDPCRWT